MTFWLTHALVLSACLRELGNFIPPTTRFLNVFLFFWKNLEFINQKTSAGIQAQIRRYNSDLTGFKPEGLVSMQPELASLFQENNMHADLIAKFEIAQCTSVGIFAHWFEDNAEVKDWCNSIEATKDDTRARATVKFLHGKGQDFIEFWQLQKQLREFRNIPSTSRCRQINTAA
jgi:hypothetical protein